MPTLNNMQIPPPKNWQDFEDLCCDLFREFWKDPETQKNGRQGQPQNGVDIYGRPNQGNEWSGIQCKNKDNYETAPLTEIELKEEVEKAKQFEPKLYSFSLATTVRRDTNIQQVARLLTDTHLKIGLFSVQVLFWDDIILLLTQNVDVVKKHYPQLFEDTAGVSKKLDEFQKLIKENLIHDSSKTENIQTINIQDNVAKYSYKDIVPTILNTEYQAELDHVKELIESNKPIQAINILNNIKERAWHNTTDIVKFRIQTNIAACKLELNEEQDAAKLFINALQYNPDDEKAQCNASLGYLILNERSNAKELLDKVLSNLPLSERGNALLIQLSPKEKSLNQIHSEIPESLKSNSEVLYSIARIARGRGFYNKYEEFLESAMLNDKSNSLDLKSEYATVIIDNISKNKTMVFSYSVSSNRQAKVNKAIQLLTDAWNTIKNTEKGKYRVGWIFNRGLAYKLMGNTDAAIKDLDEAIYIDPENVSFIKHHAMLLLEADKNEDAINSLKNILAKNGLDDTYTLLAESLRKVNRQTEAVKIIKSFLSKKPDSEWKYEALRLLVILHLDLGDFSNADKNVSLLKEEQPNEISNIIIEVIYLRALGKTNNVTELLQQAKILIDEKTAFRDIFELANQFYLLNNFDEAEKLYVKIVDQNSDNLISRRYATCLYELGKRKELFELCDSVMNSSGLTRFFTEIALSAYNEIGDLKKANEISIEYLKNFSDDIEIKSQKALIDLRLGKEKDVKRFLDSKFDYNQISLQTGMRIAFLYSTNNRADESIQLMYELRRKHFNNPEAHLKYVGFFLGNENQILKLLKTEKISVNTAVSVIFDSDHLEWFIIEDRKDADLIKHEINYIHPIAKKLIGKKVGDVILIKRDSLSEDKGEVREVKSKYLYALHESISRFSVLFPDVPGIWTIKHKTSKKKEDIQQNFDVFFQQVQKRQLTISQIESLYLEGKLTIGSISNILSIDPLEVLAGLIRKPDLGLRVCLGTSQERQKVDVLFDFKETSLVLDIIAILTIHNINGITELEKSGIQFIVSQSTIDLLNEMIYERKKLEDKEYMVISYEDDSYFRNEISKEDRKKGIEFLNKTKDWIENSCDIVPIDKTVNLNRNYQLELNSIFGKPFIDSILIAKVNGRLLYTDDERLRAFAKGEFDVDGIWTQAVLNKLLASNYISLDRYNALIIKLATLNYRHTSINSDLLIEAAKQSKWVPLEPFESVIRMLNGSNSDVNSAIVVSVNFLFNLWISNISANNKIYFLIKLLGELMINRNKDILLSNLILEIKKKFLLVPMAEKNILKAIEIWQKSVA